MAATHATTMKAWVIALGVLGAVAVLVLRPFPHSMFWRAHRHEDRLTAHLHQLRHAVAMFQADTGMWPGTLTDLIAPDEPALAITVPRGTYNGPYLTTSGGIAGTGIPRNPRCDPQNASVSDHWEYDKTSGTVRNPFRVQDPGYDPRMDL